MSRAGVVRVGMLGAAHVHAPGWARQLAGHPGAEFIGVYDADPDRATTIASPLGVRAVATEAELLDNSDAVVVSAENRAAPGLVEAAAAAGRPVMCEKPLGSNRAEGAAMLAACEVAGVGLSVAFDVRYAPAARKLRALVGSGALGNSTAIWATNHGAYPGGWFGDPARSGGGCLIDHVVHVADLLRWIWGAEFTSVRAEAATRHNPGLPVEDCGLLLATMSDGAAVSLDSSWSRHARMPGAVDVTMEVIAEAGHLHLDAFADHIELFRSDGRVEYKSINAADGPCLIDEWLVAVAEDKPLPVTGLDGYRASELAWAAIESAAEHRTVTLPLPSDPGRAYA